MHLYLHVPFCARRCSYCDFAIAVRRSVPSRRFVEQIVEEWGRWLADGAWDDFSRLRTIYLGGGTPSRLAPEAIGQILACITKDRPLAPDAEVTLEANPEDVTSESTRAWRAAGVTRVSLGVQSFDPRVLAWMHRSHTVQQVAPAIGAIREAGIAGVSLDLIYALPPELERDWERDLDQALALVPEHLSLYGLTVESHTPLAHWVDRGEAHPPPDERYAAEFLAAHGRLTQAGYQHYEVSNYARPGCEAVHNSAYWQRSAYLGLGPSAHSALGNRRWWNVREWEAWSGAIRDGISAVAGDETLGSEATRIERLYLGLRTVTGIPASDLKKSLTDTWAEQEWASVEQDRIRLTPEGWLRLDALVAAASL